MSVAVLGLSHHTSSVEVLEKFAFRDERLERLEERLRAVGGLREHVVLSTCNRSEIYAHVGDADTFRREVTAILADLSGVDRLRCDSHLYLKKDAEAVRHLFRVAAGMDSMALGETEILGQVKASYLRSHEAGRTGARLNKLFQKALHIGKNVRTHTALGRGKVSVASIAVDMARRIFMDLSLRTVVLLGAGEMGAQALESLGSKGAGRLLVLNRHPDRARELASRFGGESMDFARMDEAAREADILIASTAVEDAIIDRSRAKDWMEKRRKGSLLLLDLGIPRNIEAEVAELDGVYLFNLDDLKEISEENLRERQKAIADCDVLIDRAVAVFVPMRA
ncbi:MAG: glutamyl-tRNA reductase [Candidatus Omnitrophica bacterium]|nr:glutamyl-tRNA reductase [Candidatus Omnitrophota bacterium]